MSITTVNKSIDYILLATLLLIFVLLHIPAIDLGYFWDESWVYAPAVQFMAKNGPSLHPLSLDVDLSRGHPLFFHFLFSSCILLMGNSFIALHSIALCIAVLGGGVFYKLILDLSDTRTALLGTALLLSQTAFFAQATLVLPEVLLALLLLTSFWAFLFDKRIIYFLSTSMGLLTKETFLAIIFSYTLWAIYEEAISKSKKTITEKLKSKIYVASPIFPLLIFFYLQYLSRSWILYPDHLDMVDTSVNAVIYKLYEISRAIFFEQWRIVITATTAVSLFFYGSRNKENFDPMRSKAIRLAFLLLIIYVSLSAFNFFSLRYIVPLLPLFLLITLLTLRRSLPTKAFFLASALCITSSSSYIIMSQSLDVRDINISFWEYCKIQDEAVTYIESLNIYDKPIKSSFLMYRALDDKNTGYRHTAFQFELLTNWKDLSGYEQAYYIYSNLEPSDKYESTKNKPNSSLVERFEMDQAWVEIYKVQQSNRADE